MASIHPPRDTDWAARVAPDLRVFEALASETLAELPAEILGLCGVVTIMLAEYPDDALLDDLGLDDPNDLLGIFEGNALTAEAAAKLGAPIANRVWLFRRPILDYWATQNEPLGAIVAHVLIFEIGQHFGLSEDELESIEAAMELNPGRPRKS